jgi:hypothetical protein
MADGERPERSKVRLWCIRAQEAPVACVFARRPGEPRWMCLLRWDCRNGKVKEGAWTQMDVLVRRCFLSSDGQFLLYAARGSLQGPFNASHGGSYAVSRAPWLTALTDPRTIGPEETAYESEDALRRSSQKRLWGMFEHWLKLGAVKWPHDLGFGWTEMPADDPIVTRQAMRHGARLAARIPLDGPGLSLVAVVDCRANKNGEPEWNIWQGDLRYFVVSEKGGSTRVGELHDVRWAAPAKGARVLVATSDACVQVLRLSQKDALGEAPEVESSVILDGLKPRPGSAPAWAREELDR